MERNLRLLNGIGIVGMAMIIGAIIIYLADYRIINVNTRKTYRTELIAVAFSDDPTVSDPARAEMIGTWKIDYTSDFGINDEGSLTIEYQAAGVHTGDGKMLPAEIWSKVKASTQGKGPRPDVRVAAAVSGASLSLTAPTEYSFDIKRIAHDGADRHIWLINKPKSEGDFKILVSLDGTWKDKVPLYGAVSVNGDMKTEGRICQLLLPVNVTTDMGLSKGMSDLLTYVISGMGFLLTLPILQTVLQGMFRKKDA
jgi:hypothetical protein